MNVRGSVIRLLVGAMIFLLSSLAVAEMKAGKYPKVYNGDEGIKVTVVELQDADPKQALVLVTGVQTRIDDVVLLHTLIPDGKGFGMETYVNDSAFWTLRASDERYWGKSMTLTLPEKVMDRMYLGYNEKLSKEVKPDEIVKRYQKELSDGTIQKIMRYEGKDVVARTNGVYKRAVDDAKSACEAPIGAKIDWSTVKDAQKGKLPLATLCRQPAEVLMRHCLENKKHNVAQKINLIKCSVGSVQKLSLGSDKQLLWQVPAAKELNLGDLNSQLEKML